MSVKPSSSPYFLAACSGATILQGFPGQVDTQESGEHWLARTIKQATANLDTEHLLRSVAKTSAYYVDDAKLWHLYTNPSHLPTSTLYRHATNLLLKETPSLSPMPAPKVSHGFGMGSMSQVRSGTMYSDGSSHLESTNK